MGSNLQQIVVFSGVLIHENKVLMALRNEEECKDAHLKWEFPGGKVDFGETPEKALKREFLEETGIEVQPITLLPYVGTHYWEYDWGQQQTLCFVYLCKLIREGKRQKDHHIEKVEWFMFENARKQAALPGTRAILDIVQKEI